MNANLPVTPSDIRTAAARIAPEVRRTPLLRLPGRALGLELAEVWLKLEQLQLGGSFKARGMFNRLLAQPLSPSYRSSVPVRARNAQPPRSTSAARRWWTCCMWPPRRPALPWAR